ncbi:hypothetical protein ACRTDU_03925 [Sunxiuqinia elliptica]
MKRALKIGQLIANAHPDRVRLLFDRYGITAQPSGKTILDGYLVYGEPFLHDLFQIAYEGMSQFSGIYELETDKLLAGAQAKVDAVTTAQEKSSIWDGLSNIFGKAGDFLSSGVGIYNSISGLLGGKKVDTGTSTSSEAQLELEKELIRLQVEQQNQAQQNQFKTYLLVGAGLIVVVLLAAMFIKSSK